MKAKLTARLIASLAARGAPYEVVDTELNGFLLRVQPSGVMTYYFAYRNQGTKRKRFRIGRHGSISPAAARDTALRLSARVIEGEDIQATKKTQRLEAEKAKYRTLGGFVSLKYEPWAVVERKRGAETVARIKANFGHLLERPMSEISKWDVQKWRVTRIKAGKAKTTLNRDVGALSACLAKAVEWQYLERHPLEGLKPLKTDRAGRVRYLSAAEERSLMAALEERENSMRQARVRANQWRADRQREMKPDFDEGHVDHLRPMVLLTMNTGLRLGEALSLEWSDVNLEEGVLTLRGANTKSGHSRRIPLNKTARSVLSDWQASGPNSGLVFPARNGQQRLSVRRAWHGVLAAAGITDFRWHDLRHHFASQLVMRGVDLNTVRDLLGHAQLDMTLRYAHLSPDHRAEAVGRLDDETESSVDDQSERHLTTVA